MRLIGKASLPPTMGIVTSATSKITLPIGWFPVVCALVAQPATAPSERAAPVFSAVRRLINCLSFIPDSSIFGLPGHRSMEQLPERARRLPRECTLCNKNKCGLLTQVEYRRAERQEGFRRETADPCPFRRFRACAAWTDNAGRRASP